jgi:hypothetical protein
VQISLLLASPPASTYSHSDAPLPPIPTPNHMKIIICHELFLIVHLPLHSTPPGSSLFEASKEERRLRVRSWAEKHAMQMKTTLRLLTASWWPLQRSQAVWEASTMSQSQHWFLRLFLEVTVWTIADSTLAVLREMIPPLPPSTFPIPSLSLSLTHTHPFPIPLSLSLSLSHTHVHTHVHMHKYRLDSLTRLTHSLTHSLTNTHTNANKHTPIPPHPTIPPSLPFLC